MTKIRSPQEHKKSSASVYLLSLGCAKNQVDAERTLTEFKQQGFRWVKNPYQADVVVVNTCAFIHSAEEEAVEALLAAADLKRRGKIRMLLGAGCLVARYGEKKIRTLFPELDGATKPEDYHHLAKLAADAFFSRQKDQRPTCESSAGGRVLLSGPRTAYLKIAEGCNRQCSYCLIPRLRGPLRSVALDQLIIEANTLAQKGVKEFIVVAQDITAYGKDLPQPKPHLTDLLDALVKVPGIQWIRLMYANPDGITEALIQRMASAEKICKYLDVPLQHASQKILRKMGRPGSGKEYLQRIAKLRRRIPGIVLRTTLLSGFPGETEADHQTLMEFVRQARFNRLGVFAYSRERGTRAASMPGQVSRAVRERRRSELMQLQAEISHEHLAQQVGKVVECLVEEPLGAKQVLGRTVGDAPEVDGGIVLQGRAQPGQIVRARITGATEHDLIGTIL